MAADKPRLPKTITKFGFTSPYPMNDLQWELFGFADDRSPERGGLGKYKHFRNAADVFLPNLVWNEWLETQIESLCRSDYALQKSNRTTIRYVSWAGPAAAGKTFAASLYSFLWWQCDPQNSIVLLTSTTGKMVRRRVWPEIQKLFWTCKKTLAAHYGTTEARTNLGHMVDSQTMVQAVQGDHKHSISAIPVAEGGIQKAMANIQGQHAPRMLVVVDEADATPEAIVKVCENLKAGCQDFTLLLIANPDPGMNPHRDFSEPLNGWHTISVEDEEWYTKVGGICLHFDGFKSPNVKKGRTIHPHIYTYEDYLDALKKDSENSIEGWKYDRGFWAPEGVRDTVFTPAMVDRCDGKGTIKFHSYAFLVAALDPAFGGDRCRLRIGKIGDLNKEGKIGIQLLAKYEIKALATSKDTVDKQISDEATRICRLEGVLPEHFATDATGIGRGVYSHMATDWSHRILRVEFGGLPSDLPVSTTDLRPSKEVYDRRVTELWFACAEFLLGGQLKGLTKEDIEEFCSRKFVIKTRKYVLQTKEECKERLKRSPDDADAISVMIELARHLGASANGLMKGDPNSDWETKCDEINSVYDEIVYAPEEDMVA